MMKKSVAVDIFCGLLVLIAVCNLQFLDACATHSARQPTRTDAALVLQRAKADLRAIFEECWNYTAFRQIHQAEVLHMNTNPVRLPELSAPPPDPKGNVHRPFLDETISLACAAGSSQPNDVVWKHEGHPLALNQTAGTFRYSRARDNSLTLHNVTYAAWGKFECLQRCQMEAWCVQAEYWVFPKPVPRVHEVFTQRLLPVVVPRYTPFSVTCQLEFPCSPEPAQHFVWRYSGIYLSWPPGHYLQQTACIDPDRQTLMIHTNSTEITGADGRQHCASTLTLHVPWPEHKLGSQVECWARSDTTQQEWYVLATPVQFNGSLPFPG
ncbi:uncharacterized protein LOC129587219 [Paramacrobiotus metropolitanus]|uniref:uncharacterized protein LOC129587219 n=1 Tax=Paramacrobiotus metropolitanus TaxID=2943436 RepID=UPI002445934A|nr:uncharacterized protein LOC129587219 [Paramacrobiotus metropolitanus]